ncbi:MAG TPA: peptidoglycan-binding protein [Caulobacteraceae bacterium]
MTAAARRSAQEVDTRSREIAQTLARQSGLSLSEWIDSLMRLEDADGACGNPADSAGDVATALDGLLGRVEAAEVASARAISGIEETVRAVLSRLVEAGREQVAVAARFEGAVQEVGAEQARIADRLRRVEAEGAGPRSAEALRSLEATLGKMAGHLYEGEGRTREAIDEITAKLRRVETAEPAPPVDFTDKLAGLAARLEQAESRTSATLRNLEGSLHFLDTRLGAMENSTPETISDPRLDDLAVDLGQRIEASRAELEARLGRGAESRLDTVERDLASMNDHLRSSEQRSHDAIEGIGRQVIDLGQSLVARVDLAERSGAEAIEQLGGEVSRVTHTVEARLTRADSVQAQALDKLGEEIGRISERLAERIATADRRSAQAIEEVGDQMARVTERLGQRHERTSEDLAERIRLSEARTARVLKETREVIEHLAHPRRRDADIPGAIGLPIDAEQAPLFGEDPFIGFSPPPPAAEAVVSRPVFSQEDLDLADRFPAADPVLAEDARPEPAPVAQVAGPLDGQDDIADLESTRLAALFEDPPEAREEPPPVEASPEATPGAQLDDTILGPPVAALLTTREAVQKARTAVLRAAGGPRTTLGEGDAAAAPSLFSGRRFDTASRRASLGTPAMGLGLAAAFGIALGGFWFIEGAPHGAISTQLAALMSRGPPTHAARSLQARAGAGAPSALPQLAVALFPPSASLGAGAPQEDLAAAYAGALARLAAHDGHGLDDLRRIANLGYAPAQFYLAKLYENGGEGVNKDPIQARMWTQQAARSGDARAMHNLALDFFEGTGGVRNTAVAAELFAKAAAMGVPDSQYNLGRLYEEGLGVTRNAAEAYKWYLIAARSGDAESRAGAARVKAALDGPARAAAERSAAAFTPSQANSPAGAATAAAPNAVATAQKALSALGYYQGPSDGAESPALRLALNAYQHDQGLAATGAPDADTLGRLAPSAR